MKKSIYLFAHALLLCTIGVSQNLISNPGFETGNIPTTGDQVPYATGWDRGCGTNYNNVNPSNPLIGTPDLFDSRSTNCSYDIPVNKWTLNTPTQGGNYRYVGFSGKGNENGLSYFGETVRGTITQPLASGCTYNISLYASCIQGVQQYGPCGTLTNFTPNNIKIEVVLRKDNSCTTSKLIYTTPLMTNTNSWINFSGSFSLTPAEVANGFNKIEFRLNNNHTTPFGNYSNAIFLDDVSLVLVQGPVFNSDFTVTAVNIAGSTTDYKVTATVASIPVGCSWMWDAREIDLNTGAIISGTIMGNPVNWQNTSSGYTNTFPGYCCNSSQITGDGAFKLGHKYQITRGTWGACAPWNSLSKIVYMNNGAKLTEFPLIIETIANKYPMQEDLLFEKSSNAVANENTTKIYPNPNYGLFNIELSSEKFFSLAVYDYIGKKIFEKANMESKTTIDLSLFPKGVYFLKINSSNGIEMKSVVIQ